MLVGELTDVDEILIIVDGILTAVDRMSMTFNSC
jgi:hypothetical protein